MKEILIDKGVLTSIHTINFLNSDENSVITISNDFIFFNSLQYSEVAGFLELKGEFTHIHIWENYMYYLMNPITVCRSKIEISEDGKI